MLHQAVLLPEPETMTSVQDQMQHACTLYQTYLDRHQDIDDFDVLLDVLNELSAAHDMVFWMGSEGVSTIAWYIQNAMVHNDGHIDITLDPIQLTYWGPKSFMTSVMQTLEHENIHLKQRDKMGAQKFKTLPSGYQIGLQKAEHVEEHQKHRTVMRSYFRDPHELMAHGHDVCREAQQASSGIPAECETLATIVVVCIRISVVLRKRLTS